jgi:hypothetical protein
MEDFENTWSTNESLLQSYRTIFISSQSFLLAVGAITTTGKNSFLLQLFWSAIAIIGLIMIIWFWMPIVRARGRIVDYYKFGRKLAEEQRMKLCTETEYVNNKEARRIANELLGLKTNLRTTRKKVDLWLPILFSCVWIILAIFVWAQSEKVWIQITCPSILLLIGAMLGILMWKEKIIK